MVRLPAERTFLTKPEQIVLDCLGWLVGWLVEPETCATPAGGIVSINPEVKSLHEVR